MGLKDQLQQQGSTLSQHDGKNPPINMGATAQSKLHADGNLPSYSLNGANFAIVNAAYQAYEDGVVNMLPQPSILDLNGATPSKYTDNLPG